MDIEEAVIQCEMEKHRITVFCIEYNKSAGEGALP